MKLIFFDGNCPMCNSWVKRIIRSDRKKIFRFASLESDSARQYLAPLMPDYLKEDTIIYYEDGHVYLRSDAIIRISQKLGFPFSSILIGRLIPKKVRDSIYRWIASRRYKYGKRYDSCPLPPPEWRDRFLS